ncbi:hypothetical protein SR1949_48320 [Sphaerospermopsis reniformis]|uniref:Uncharacterized protein n=1 Tax=Sphaerospermopsis reniformis TaxID=531300 RepID=A0A480AC55_9CYAN|nr:hypothetical protein [Sphaerospermopsis reniformis]GCL39704.1 hypothetical protein SR1949_48320 [Sphaerospermopsis reniformis]
MSIENVSPQMEKRFEVLDEMIEKGYIEPVKPLFDWLPTLCYFPNKTSNFDNAPPELKKQFNLMFSWYAFFLGICAFLQTRLQKDYIAYASIIIIFLSLIPPTPFDYGFGLGIAFYFSQCFVFTRYYQYKTHGRCPTNRNTFSVICLSLIYSFPIIIAEFIIQSILYPEAN